MKKNSEFLKFILNKSNNLIANNGITSKFRKYGIEGLEQYGLPTHRRGNEEWKYTNLNKMTSQNYSSTTPDIDNNKIGKLNKLSLSEHLEINVINGKLSLPNNNKNENIQVRSLSNKTLNENDINFFNSLVEKENTEIAYLNTAICEDMILLEVKSSSNSPAKCLLNIINTNNNHQAIISSPRIFINVDDSSEFEIIENHISLTDENYYTNSVIEILVNNNAKVNHYRILEDSEKSIHTNTTRVNVLENANFYSAAFSKGTELARYDLKVNMPSINSFVELDGLYFTSGKQHLDNYINLDHIAPHCTSRINYKGILDGQSHAIFGGTVQVREGAIKTDSLQSDKNLVLSPKAEIDSKPSLFIYVDDILAGHGATAGNIDEKTVYYMRSRGLDLQTASKMLISGFAMEIISKVEIQALSDYLIERYIDTLPSYKFDF